MAEQVNHPAHYGGADNVYEAIKVIDAWRLGFCLGSAVKYICRHGKKVTEKVAPDDAVAARRAAIEDLKKARWYVDHEIETLSRGLDS
jgi:Protein of unknwon function (DUF3310)